MKIRNCFVANSSSSSFILALDKSEYDAKTLIEELWSDKEYLENPYDDNNEDMVTLEDAAQYMLDNIKLLSIENQGLFENIMTCYKEESISIRMFEEYHYVDKEGNVWWRIPKEGFDFFPNFVKHKKVKDIMNEVRRQKSVTKSITNNNNQLSKEIIKLILKKLKEKYPNKYFYTAEFGDHDGVVGSTLEHGNEILENKIILKQSNH